MHFHVLGVGAIGSLLAHHLRCTRPHPDLITLIYRTQEQRRIAQASGTITIEYEDRSSESSIGYNFEPKNGSYSGGSIESLFVTTKAHTTLPALLSIVPRITPSTTIVLFQNGVLGVYKELLEKVKIFQDPAQRPYFILASNSNGVWKKGTTQMVHAGNGGIDFGIMENPRLHGYCLSNNENLDPRSPSSLRSTILALLDMKSVLNTSWVSGSDIQLSLRRKLVSNAIINPLTSLMDCVNGALFGSGSDEPNDDKLAGFDIMTRVCKEAAAVFEAEAIGKGGKQSTTSILLGSEAMVRECVRVAGVTARNTSSMLADMRGKRKTEIEYLNGYLVDLGEKFGVEMEATRMLLRLVQLKERLVRS